MSGVTRYAKSGDVHIAYQVVGDGPTDVIFVAGWLSHIELDWTFPANARLFKRLASFSRLIRYADRGRHTLKGVPGEWDVMTAQGDSVPAAV